jgi:general secretion pathway protein H
VTPCRASGVRRRRAAGFTLIEMTVVLVIMAIGTTLAVPLIEGGFDSREVRRAARQIASTMHHCRGEAVAQAKPQEMIISPDRNAIATNEWKRWATLTDRAVIERVDGGNVLGDGAVQILFFPNGSTSGADVVIASRRDRTRNRLRISVDPLVGTVRVEDATS